MIADAEPVELGLERRTGGGAKAIDIEAMGLGAEREARLKDRALAAKLLKGEPTPVRVVEGLRCSPR